MQTHEIKPFSRSVINIDYPYNTAAFRERDLSANNAKSANALILYENLMVIHLHRPI